jgi:DNA-binding NtrC family response regulator
MAPHRPDLPLSGKVLIAEDQPELLQILCRLLGSLGFDPYPARSGDEACALLRGGLRPALVITDAVMPGTMQLSDILAEARRADPGVGVLIISGYDGSQFDGLPPDLEGVEFLQKPFSLALMTQTVRAMMAGPPERLATG